MRAFLTYLFWPNPGNLNYGDPQAIAVLLGCGLLIVASFAIRYWRRSLVNPVTRKLSRSWSVAVFWFGAVGIVLLVSRVEPVLFLAMRFMWVLWILALAAFLAVQILQFRARHYTVIKKERAGDPRDAYLPKKRKN